MDREEIHMKQHLFHCVAVARVVFIQDFEVDPGQSPYILMVLAELRLWNIGRNKGNTFYNHLICADKYDVKHEKQTNTEESVLGLHQWWSSVLTHIYVALPQSDNALFADTTNLITYSALALVAARQQNRPMDSIIGRDWNPAANKDKFKLQRH